jgi:hypothetical protein
VTLAGPAMRGPGWAAGCSGPGGGRADPGGARGAIRGGERTIGDLKRGHTRRPYARSVRDLAGALGVPFPGQLATPVLVPRQLSAPVRHFAGRQAELDLLTGLRGPVGAAPGPVLITAIGLMAGSARPPWRCTGRIRSPAGSRTGSCMSTCGALTLRAGRWRRLRQSAPCWTRLVSRPGRSRPGWMPWRACTAACWLASGC